MATEDRLSDLPESVLLDILSLLPDKREVVRTSVLSKQWRFLWKSVPISLYFSPDKCDSSDQDIVDFVASTNRELHYWRSFQIIYRVTIFFPYEERYAKDVDLWVYFSTQVANVQEFALGFNYISNYEFPKFAYKSTSLRIMLLCNCILNPSDSVNWSSLVKLCISNLNLKEAVLEKILAGCPNLEWLNMNTVWGIHHLEINSHKLRKLIINDYIIEESHVKNSQLLDILAPNIENFQFLESCHETHLSLRNMASLITANLDFKTFDGQYNLEEVCTNFKELLHSVAHVENLELGPWCLQILSLLELQGWQFPASSWKFLKLNTALEQQDFPGIFRLLQSSSDLETMVIEQEKQNPRQQSGSRFTNENKDSRRHMKDYYNYSLLQLKTIKIIYFHGPQSANLFALPLVKYLLKNATVLEKLVVAARFEGSDVSQDYVEMEQEIRSFPRSSPYASVVFSYSEHESVTYLVEWTYH